MWEMMFEVYDICYLVLKLHGLILYTVRYIVSDRRIETQRLQFYLFWYQLFPLGYHIVWLMQYHHFLWLICELSQEQTSVEFLHVHHQTYILDEVCDEGALAGLLDMN